MGPSLSSTACDGPDIFKMRLIGNTVLLAPLPQRKMSDGGVALIERYQDDRKQWLVKAVGQGLRLKDGTRLPPEVRVGDKCLCNVGVGNRYTFDDGSVIVEADQIEAIWQ